MAAEERAAWVQQEGSGARFRKHGVWGDETLAEVFDRAAARDAAKTPVLDETRRVTYGELRDEHLLAQVLVDLKSGRANRWRGSWAFGARRQPST